MIETLKQSIDIVEFISEFIDLKRRANSEYVGLCPFHSENKPSFYVNREKQVFHCFGCNAHGDVITFVMKYYNYTFKEAVAFLAEKYGIEMYVDNKHEKKEASLLKKLNDFFVKNIKNSIGMEYLIKRGFTQKTIEDFNIGFVPGGWKLKFTAIYGDIQEHQFNILPEHIDRRISFPIIENNKVVGFAFRSLGPSMSKYLNSKFSKNNYLFGYDFIKDNDTVVIVEGYTDVMMMYQYNIPAVAIMGTSISEQQLAKILKKNITPYLMFDSDTAGIKSTIQSLIMLQSKGILPGIISIEGKSMDPDEFLLIGNKIEFKDRIESIIDFIKKIGYSNISNDLAGKLTDPRLINAISKQFNVPAFFITNSSPTKTQTKYNINEQNKEQDMYITILASLMLGGGLLYDTLILPEPYNSVLEGIRFDEGIMANNEEAVKLYNLVLEKIDAIYTDDTAKELCHNLSQHYQQVLMCRSVLAQASQG